MIELGSFAASSPRHRTRRHEAALCFAHKVGEELIALDAAYPTLVPLAFAFSAKEDTLMATLQHAFFQYLPCMLLKWQVTRGCLVHIENLQSLLIMQFCVNA
jgi:hypothetical protein